MAAVTVSFDGTRVNDAEANTNWANFVGGGPAPAAEAQLKYQGNNAVNKKITSTTQRQGVAYDPGASALDMTAAANKLWFVKGYVADFGDLNTTYGCEAALGSSNGDYYSYNIAGSGANRSVFSAYPNQGGYLILAIDPNISAWREGTTGTPSLTAVDFFAFGAQFVTGGAKSENMALDAIDVGTGLTITRGDGVDTDGTFQDFVDTDEGTVSNRWGVVRSQGGAILAIGMLSIGNGTVDTEFTDNSAVVLFPDGYHSAGLVGITIDISRVGNVIDVGSTIIGRGSSTTEDTRPDHIVSGTSGTYTFTGVLQNHRNVTLTSACSVSGAEIECELLTQSSADIDGATIRTNSVTQVACLQDPTFGTTTDLRDTEFSQAGAGHAIEIDTAGDYQLQGLLFTGYGSTGSNDAAILNSSTGTVNISVVGGGTLPTYRNSNGGTTTVTADVSVTLTGMQDNTEVRVYEAGTTTEIDGIEDATAGSPGDRSFTFTDTAGNDVDIVIHNVNYQYQRIDGFTIPSNDTSLPISQQQDRNYENP